jgi:hypothetical protein
MLPALLEVIILAQVALHQQAHPNTTPHHLQLQLHQPPLEFISMAFLTNTLELLPLFATMSEVPPASIDMTHAMILIVAQVFSMITETAWEP